MQASNETDILAKRLDFLTRKILPLLGEGWTLDAERCSFSKLVVPLDKGEEDNQYQRGERTLTVTVYERRVGTFKQRGTGKLYVSIKLGSRSGTDYTRAYDVKDDGSFNVKKFLAVIGEFKARAQADIDFRKRKIAAQEQRSARIADTQARFQAAFPGQFEHEYSTMTLPSYGGASIADGVVKVSCVVKNPETLKAIIALLEAEVTK